MQPPVVMQQPPVVMQQPRVVMQQPPPHVTISVNSYINMADGHAEFQIATQAPGLGNQRVQFNSQHRYREFEALHSQIHRALGMGETFNVPKTLFTPSESVKRERCTQLTHYLTHAVRQSISHGAPPALCAFLAVDASIFMPPQPQAQAVATTPPLAMATAIPDVPLGQPVI